MEGYVLLDGITGIVHATISDQFRYDRMCELRHVPRSSFPGNVRQKMTVTCIPCIVEGVEYERVMRGLRGA